MSPQKLVGWILAGGLALSIGVGVIRNLTTSDEEKRAKKQAKIRALEQAKAKETNIYRKAEYDRRIHSLTIEFIEV